MKVPDNWLDYDIVAQPTGGAAPQRVSVKSYTFTNKSADFIGYMCADVFDWLAAAPAFGLDLTALSVRPADVETSLAESQPRASTVLSSPTIRCWKRFYPGL